MSTPTVSNGTSATWMAMPLSMKRSCSSRSERLEQLRFMDNGIPIHVAEVPFDTVGVDTEEDLKRVEQILLKK